MGYFLMVLLFFVSLFMMFIVLLQRGRGGGLAGALGGMGGQSVLGTKAGDVFTKITVTLAVVWVLLAGFGGMALRNSASKYDDSGVVSAEDKAAAENAAKATPPIQAADDADDPAPADSTPTDATTPAAAETDAGDATPDAAADTGDAAAPAESETPAESTPESTDSE